jgi:phage-related protein
MAKNRSRQISEKTDRPMAAGGATKPKWKYSRYPADDANWDLWYEARNEAVRGKFEDVFETLEDNTSWHRTGFYRPLAKGDGLGEVKVKEGHQWRFFGFFGLDRQEFAIMMICYHKDTNYEPRDAIDTGKKRMKEIKTKKTQRISCERPGRDDGED